jgi:hypothetical protein
MSSIEFSDTTGLRSVPSFLKSEPAPLRLTQLFKTS